MNTELDPRSSAPALTIAAVERDTRIGKDTLRVWERRYGFPLPGRDVNGERLYPPDQVERLRHIKRLLDAGHRPGRIVGLPLDGLLQLSAASRHADDAPTSGAHTHASNRADLQALMALIQRPAPGELRSALSQALLREGLPRFITQLAVPLLAEVGQSWSRGQLDIFKEHLFSDVLETVLRSALAALPTADSGRHPRVLLSTFPHEAHGLGLLMAEGMLALQGAATMSLGRQTPLRDVLLASQALDADIVAVSFSAASQVTQSIDALAELREILPSTVEIWAGTPLAALQRRPVGGVQVIATLEAIADELVRWHHERS